MKRQFINGEEKMEKDQYKSTRILCIIEAALEYFFVIAVSSVYLAKLTAYIGISDALTGILSSFVSLGCGFQIISVFLKKRKSVKTWVIGLSMLCQILFALLFVVPIVKFSKTVKTICFVSLLLFAQIILNVIYAPKTNWYMSLIEDKKRGGFTAKKEIVSLIGGIIVSYVLGMLIDYYTERNDMRTAFIIMGIGLFVLMILHALTLIFSKEKTNENIDETSSSQNFKKLIKDRSVLKLIIVAGIWNIAQYATLSFTGTYQTKELGFTTTFASLIIIIGSLARIVVSMPLGKIADKHSFANMFCICVLIESVAFGINIFTAPQNGTVLYTIFYVLYCIGMGGINSSLVNLVYDYINEDQRTAVIAINQTVFGLSGFGITLLLSPVIDIMQKHGNKLFGVTVYAQQLFSALSMLCSLFLVWYVIKVVKKMKRCDETTDTVEKTEIKKEN